MGFFSPAGWALHVECSNIERVADTRNVDSSHDILTSWSVHCHNDINA